MASVGAAIANVNFKRVDECLWWNSFSETLDAFYQAGYSIESRTQYPSYLTNLKSHLENQHAILLQTVQFFKTASQSSKDALDSSRIECGKNHLDIKSNIKTIALKLSEELNLDQIQSYILVLRTIESEEDENITIENVKKFYYYERTYILRCVMTLFSIYNLSLEWGIDVSKNEIFKLIENEINSLINEKILNNFFYILKGHLEIKTNSNNFNSLTITMLEEVEIIFDTFIQLFSFSSCSSQEFHDLYLLISKNIFDKQNHPLFQIHPFLPNSKQKIEKTKNSALFSLLSALKMDSLLLCKIQNKSYSHSFSLDDINGLQNSLLKTLENLNEFEFIFKFFWKIFQNNAYSLLSYTSMNVQLLGGEAKFYNLLFHQLFLIFDNLLSFSKANAFVYRKIFINLISSFIHTYDNQIQTFNLQSSIFKFFEIIFKDEVTFSSQLCKKKEIFVPIDNFTSKLFSIFPFGNSHLYFQFLSFICHRETSPIIWKILFTDVFIRSITEKCFLIFNDSHNNSQSQTIIKSNGQLSNIYYDSDFDFIVIPPNTVGEIFFNQEDKAFVKWNCGLPPLLIILLKIKYISKSNHLNMNNYINELKSYLMILNKLITCDEVFVANFLNLNEFLPLSYFKAHGFIHNYVELDFIEVMIDIFNFLFAYDHDFDYDVLSLPILIINEFIPRLSKDVIKKINFYSLFKNKIKNNVDFFHAHDPKFQNFLLTSPYFYTERNTNEYSLTIAVLSLLEKFSEQGILVDDIHFILFYFSRFFEWSYAKNEQKWQICEKISNIVKNLILEFQFEEKFSQTISLNENFRNFENNNNNQNNEEIMKKKLQNLIAELFFLNSYFFNSLFHCFTLNANEINLLDNDSLISNKEIIFLKKSILSTLELVQILSAEFITNNFFKDKISFFLESLLSPSPPRLLSIFSYIFFSSDKMIQNESMKTVISLSRHVDVHFTQNYHHLISQLSSESNLRTYFSLFLNEHALINQTQSFLNAANFISICIHEQPNVIDLLLSNESSQVKSTSQNDSNAPKPNTVPTTVPITVPTASSSSSRSGIISTNPVMEALWMHVQAHDNNLKRSPSGLSHVLHIFANLWQKRIRYEKIIKSLTSQPRFWEILVCCLENSKKRPIPTSSLTTGDAHVSDSNTSDSNTSDFDNAKILDSSFILHLESSILSILTHEQFYTGKDKKFSFSKFLSSSPSSPSPPPPSSSSNVGIRIGISESQTRSILFKQNGLFWDENDVNELFSRYGNFNSPLSSASQFKMAMNALVVGLMAFVSSNNTFFLHSSLIDILNVQARKLLAHPIAVLTMQKLVISSKSQFLINLYHQIHDQMMGKNINNEYKEILNYILNDDIDITTILIQSQLIFDFIHPKYDENHVINVEKMEKIINLKSWSCDSQSIINKNDIQKYIDVIKRNNVWTSFFYSKLNALQHWKMFFFYYLFQPSKRDQSSSDFSLNQLHSISMNLLQIIQTSSTSTNNTKLSIFIFKEQFKLILYLSHFYSLQVSQLSIHKEGNLSMADLPSSSKSFLSKFMAFLIEKIYYGVLQINVGKPWLIDQITCFSILLQIESKLVNDDGDGDGYDDVHRQTDIPVEGSSRNVFVRNNTTMKEVLFNLHVNNVTGIMVQLLSIVVLKKYSKLILYTVHLLVKKIPLACDWLNSFEVQVKVKRMLDLIADVDLFVDVMIVLGDLLSCRDSVQLFDSLEVSGKLHDVMLNTLSMIDMDAYRDGVFCPFSFSERKQPFFYLKESNPSSPFPSSLSFSASLSPSPSPSPPSLLSLFFSSEEGFWKGHSPFLLMTRMMQNFDSESPVDFAISFCESQTSYILYFLQFPKIETRAMASRTSRLGSLILPPSENHRILYTNLSFLKESKNVLSFLFECAKRKSEWENLSPYTLRKMTSAVSAFLTFLSQEEHNPLSVLCCLVATEKDKNSDSKYMDPEKPKHGWFGKIISSEKLEENVFKRTSTASSGRLSGSVTAATGTVTSTGTGMGTSTGVGTGSGFGSGSGSGSGSGPGISNLATSSPLLSSSPSSSPSPSLSSSLNASASSLSLVTVPKQEGSGKDRKSIPLTPFSKAVGLVLYEIVSDSLDFLYAIANEIVLESTENCLKKINFDKKLFPEPFIISNIKDRSMLILRDLCSDLQLNSNSCPDLQLIRLLYSIFEKSLYLELFLFKLLSSENVNEYYVNNLTIFVDQLSSTLGIAGQEFISKNFIEHLFNIFLYY